jgi:hypothetical protein
MSSKYMKEVLLKDEAEAKSVDEVVETVLQEEVEVIDDGPRDKQVLIRVSEKQRGEWQKAAEADNLSVSEWLRSMANHRYREIFECLHPIEHRRSYPWSEHCMLCGARLR